MTLPVFAAIDFETASRARTSACAVGVVRVEQGRIAERRAWLIRPPSACFEFTHIHGIRWAHVRNERTFPEVWQEMQAFTPGVAFLAAHNAGFDRGVLQACLAHYRLPELTLGFVDTVVAARRAWQIRRASLPVVAEMLGLQLKHHDAASDANACAQIMLAAWQKDREVVTPLVQRAVRA